MNGMMQLLNAKKRGGKAAYLFESDANTFTCALDSTVANADETGEGGGFSGADLDLTCYGNIKAASGTPPSREFDQGCLEATAAFLNGVLRNRNTWSFAWIMHDVASGQLKFPLYARVDVYDKLFIGLNSGNILYAQAGQAGGMVFDEATAITSGAVPTTGTVLVMAWSDGTYFRAGFIVDPDTVPTKWSDFASANRFSVTCNLNQLNAAGSAYTDRGVFGENFYKWDAMFGMQFMASKSCLINNAA